ncbi:hypothetical protein OFEAOIEE_LOCUS4995 [Methylorubrum extorquens]
MKDAQRQARHHDDTAGAGTAAAPQHQRPGQDAGREYPERDVVDEAGLLQIEPAPALRRRLAAEACTEAVPLAGAGGERLHRPHIGDGIDEVARDHRCLTGIGAVDRPAAHAEADQPGGDGQDHRHQRQGEEPVDAGKDDHRPGDIDDGRDDAPDEGVDERAEIASGGGDALTERAGEILGEVAHRLTFEMLEQLDAQIDADAHGRAASEPSGKARQGRLKRDEDEEQAEREQDGTAERGRPGDGINEELQAVLLTDAAGGRSDDEEQQRGEVSAPRQHVVQDEAAAAGEMRWFIRVFQRLRARVRLPVRLRHGRPPRRCG